MTRTLETLANAFPFWVLAACSLALVRPSLFTWFGDAAILVGLGVIMLGMGLTLSLDDFARVAARPSTVAAGFAAQFVIMPLAGWSVANAMRLETPFAVGLILVACCPGGTASNVVTFIARADVALSVAMTTCSTIGAVVLTPLLTKALAGRLIEVDTWGLLVSTAKVIVLPVAAGAAINRFLPRLSRTVLPAAPLVSVALIALVCASIVGRNAATIRESAPRLLAAVVLVHAIGFGVGYLFARIVGYDRGVCRTISIEVGMQNSGLGVVLATKHFPSEPLVAVPCAISSVVHSCIGSMLAGAWRLDTALRRPSGDRTGSDAA